MLVFLVALLVVSPSLAKPNALTSPAQTATVVTTVNSTLTTATSTIVSSTSSSTELTTFTSVTTVSSTAFSYQPQGGGGIPGFPVEGILLGFILGAIVLGLLRRRSQQSVKH